MALRVKVASFSTFCDVLDPLVAFSFLDHFVGTTRPGNSLTMSPLVALVPLFLLTGCILLMLALCFHWASFPSFSFHASIFGTARPGIPLLLRAMVALVPSRLLAGLTLSVSVVTVRY